MKRAFSFLIAASAISFAAPPASSPEVTKENAMTFYRDFKRMTKEPYYVGPITSMLCVTVATPEMIERERKLVGPHHMAIVHIYANPAAEPTLAASASGRPADPLEKSIAVFPVGSVIVKEKLSHDAKMIPAAAGGMIKRAPGFDPKNGDWEFFYADKATGDLSIGKLANCIDCHNGAKMDHVFANWLTPERP